MCSRPTSGTEVELSGSERFCQQPGSSDFDCFCVLLVLLVLLVTKASVTIHKQRSQRPTLLVQQKQCLDVWSRHLIRWWTIDERFSRFVASKQPQQTILHPRIPSRFLHLDFYLHLYLHLYLHFYLHLYLDRRLSNCRTWRASIVPLFSSLPNGMSERYWTVPV